MIAGFKKLIYNVVIWLETSLIIPLGKVIHHFQITTNHNYKYNAAQQIQLASTYKLMKSLELELPALGDVGFKNFSQTDEDGILLYIFSLIGTTNKKCVEICAGDGIECNTANLIINHKWIGLLVDGNKQLVKKGMTFYKDLPQTKFHPPTFICSWITRSNVNQIIKDAGFEGEIDLLSIDLDGMDYWIWDAISIIQPRVVVVEYNDILGAKDAITVPYEDNFNAYSYPTTNGMPNYCGASLPAFVKLAKSKGYRLVGCNSLCFNAFFIQDGIGVKEIPEIDLNECFKHPKVFWGIRNRFPLIQDLPWQAV